MPEPPPLRLAAWLLCACTLAGCATAPSSPAPPPTDAVAEFLVERGLATAPSPARPVPPSAAAGAHEPAAALFADPPAAPPPERDAATGTVVTAMNFLGVGYRRGGNSADQGFDCSGFTRHIFETSLGLTLPRRAQEQAHAPDLFKVARSALRPGDLVFFNTLGPTFSHVGIYVGDGRFIHAPRSGARVRLESMDSSYWRKRFTGARRAGVLAAAAD